MMNFFKNKKGGTVIIIVFLALMGFFGVTLVASDIIKSNLIMSKTQLNSTKAYFAAEVGLEQALWEIMQDDYELPVDDQLNVFSSADVSEVDTFLDQGAYSVNYDRTNAVRTFVSTGGYLSEHRTTEVSFCLPDCAGKDCGVDDGCGTPCPPFCETDIGCRSSALADAQEVDGTQGSCCDGDICYECAESYFWNGTICEYDCIQDCDGLSCGDIDPECGLPCPASCSTNPGCVLSTDPVPSGTRVSANSSCCDVAGDSYTCYECGDGYSWNGSECFACVAHAGDPFPGSNGCYDAGVYDCFGNQSEPVIQPIKGQECSPGNEPTVSLGMNEGHGTIAYDASSNNNDGFFNGEQWSYRKKIIIDHNKFEEDMMNFVFLLDILDLDIFYRAQDDGDDIMFRDENGIRIPHEIEFFQGSGAPDPNNGRLLAWLKISRLYSARDTEIYMYYGNSTVSSQEERSRVWSGHSGVFHLDGSNAYNSVTGGATAYSGGLPNPVSGTIGIGQNAGHFSGSASAVPVVIWGQEITLSAWIATTDTFSTQNLYLAYQGWGPYGQGLRIYRGTPGYFNHNYAGGANKVLYASRSIADGDWHHIAVVVRIDTSVSPNQHYCDFYIDGQFDVSRAGCTVNTNADTANTFLSASGYVDEIRIANYEQSADIIRHSYANQLDPASYVTLSSEEGPLVSTATWVPSLYGNALEFNGAYDYLSFADGSNILSSGDFTLEAWVYPYSYNSNYRTIASRWGGDWAWALGSINRLSFYYMFTGWSSPYPTWHQASSASVPANQWTHVAVTYDVSSRQVTFYQNGVAHGPTTLSILMSGVGEFQVGRFGNGTNSFHGRIDEFRAYDYIRTSAQIQNNIDRSVCDGAGSCLSLLSPTLNSQSYQSCNDVCAADGKICLTVGTDSKATNGLMSVYNGGYCGTLLAECSTTMERNPEVSMPFLCGGYQTDWTNCNCSVCDNNYGAPCVGSLCTIAGTGITNCDGTCTDPEFSPAGTDCGTYMECDGVGNCRSVCHPLYTKPCGEDGCTNPGTVDCDGFCIDTFPKADGLTCENTTNDPLQDECWAGVCTECVANYGQPCNNGPCQEPGTIDCFGGCSACTGGNCATNPNYLAEGEWCNSGTGAQTGTCNASGACIACHSDYLNLGVACNTEECHVEGTRSCQDGSCSTGTSLEDPGTYCTTVGGDPGACLASGACFACNTGYMDPCNNSTPCHNDGTIECDGVTCSTSGYKSTGEYCNAGYLSSPVYPDTGTCDAAHDCNPCVSGYLNQEECNNQACRVPGTYTCGGGCTSSALLAAGTHCDTGAASEQDYTGTCDASGTCQSCASGFINSTPCNTEECHVVGEYDCDGVCSTLGQVSAENDPCDYSGYTGGHPDRETGYCNASGACTACEFDYVYDLPCYPPTGDHDCLSTGKVIECQGNCVNWQYLSDTTTCDTGAATSRPYSGICDGAGTCVQCEPEFLNNDDCNTGECHVVGKYDCDGGCDACIDGDCITNPNYFSAGTYCNAGVAGAAVASNRTGNCDASGNCLDCSNDYLYQNNCYPSGTDSVCVNPGKVSTCNGSCTNYSFVRAGTPCGAGTDECDGAGHCTTPIPVITVVNSSSWQSCNQVCAGAPYVSRGCLGVGTDIAGSNGIYSFYSGGCKQGVANCGTVMNYGPSYISSCWNSYGRYKPSWTRCQCGNCDPMVGQVCIAADQCNNEVLTQCNGTCPTNYIANNTTCDPTGPETDGYCWYGSCQACVETPGTTCSPSVSYTSAECINTGVFDCQGNCSAESSPYKPYGELCAGGICDGSGNCDPCNTTLNGTACPIVTPKDSECYNPGTYNCDEVCVGVQNLRQNLSCTENSSGNPGRCINGDCVSCNMAYYGQACPIVAPYHADCREPGTYDCHGDPPACLGVHNKNQGLDGCGTASYVCDEGVCTSYPDMFVIQNVATGRTCDDMCDDYSMRGCFDIGTNGSGNLTYEATNNQVVSEFKPKNQSAQCNTTTGDCSTVMSPGSYNLNCPGADGTVRRAHWTYCFCSTCDDRLFDDCSIDPMWAGTIYDEECYDFGLYDCEGNCTGNGVKEGSEGTVCTVNSTSLEGSCTSGECIQCHADYLNAVPCPTSDCGSAARACDGTCPMEIAKGVGESCGVDMECDAGGICVSAASLPDIVVENVSTDRSCDSICADYTNRYCESIGTDDTQAGGINGNIMYFGMSNDVPACISQAGSCSDIISQSPTSGGYVGYTCSEKLTNWTHCRCSNE